MSGIKNRGSMIHQDKRRVLKTKGEMDDPTHECDACGVTVSIWDLHSIGVISRVCDECYMDLYLDEVFRKADHITRMDVEDV